MYACSTPYSPEHKALQALSTDKPSCSHQFGNALLSVSTSAPNRWTASALRAIYLLMIHAAALSRQSASPMCASVASSCSIRAASCRAAAAQARQAKPQPHNCVPHQHRRGGGKDLQIPAPLPRCGRVHKRAGAAAVLGVLWPCPAEGKSVRSKSVVHENGQCLSIPEEEEVWKCHTVPSVCKS